MCVGACRWPEEGMGSLGIGVKGNCEQPDMGVWEVTSGPLQEQQALRTAEPYLSPWFCFGDRVLL